jgi:hypothetical protein
VEPNLANQEIDYRVTEGRHFVTRRFVYPTGRAFSETTSRATLLGWPLVHITIGRCPETGRRRLARGWVAIGRLAIGGLAVGQAAVGLVAIAQLGVGLLLALAQLGISGQAAIAQVALSARAAAGQIAVARDEAIGQIAIARYAMGQVGVGRHVYDSDRRDAEALAHFTAIRDRLSGTPDGERVPAAPPREIGGGLSP